MDERPSFQRQLQELLNTGILLIQIAIVGGILFVVGWLVWVFFLGGGRATPVGDWCFYSREVEEAIRESRDSDEDDYFAVTTKFQDSAEAMKTAAEGILEDPKTEHLGEGAMAQALAAEELWEAFMRDDFSQRDEASEAIQTYRDTANTLRPNTPECD